MTSAGKYRGNWRLRNLLFLFAVVALAFFPWKAAHAQIEDAGGSPGSGGASQSREESGSGIGGRIGGITNGIPALFQRRLLTRFSLGESYDTGVTDSTHTNSGDFSTTASGSLSYNYKGKWSDYGVDYSVSAYRYGRLRGFGPTVSHSFGLNQTVRLGRQTTWGLSHRFALTPGYGTDLLRDSIVQQFSFANPLPRFGTIDASANPNNLPIAIGSNPSLNPLPDLGTPTGTFVGAPQASVPFQARRTSNSTQVQLSHAFSPRTSLSFGGGYERLRYRDDDYFGSDQVGISASVGRMLSERTSLGFSYYGGRLEQPGDLDLTWTQGARISVSYQLSPGIQLSIGYGPVWVQSSGQEEIPLSPVLANLLGTPTLIRDTSVTFLSWGWNGETSLSKQWGRARLGLGYGRGISAQNALRSVSKSDSLALSLGREIGRTASISGSASYSRNSFITFQDIGKLDQASGTINLSRRITSMMDLSLFASYSKLLRRNSQGPAFIGPTEYQGYGHFGMSFVFHFPRVEDRTQ